MPNFAIQNETQKILLTRVRLRIGIAIIACAFIGAAIPFMWGVISSDSYDFQQSAIVTQASVIPVGTSSNSSDLTWTAPGDDRYNGQAARYEIRYASSDLSASSWDMATTLAHPPAPQIAGSSENTIAAGLQPNTTYYFGMKSADEAGNWSPLSNIAAITTKSISIPGCVELWSCTLWQDCSGTTQERMCVDTNACGAETNKPQIARPCSSQGEVDDMSPNTYITSAPSEKVSTSSFTFKWAGLDNATPPEKLTFSYKIDGGGWSSWSTAKSITYNLLDGTHTFQVRSRDDAKNTDPSPASVTFGVQLKTNLILGVEKGAGPLIQILSTDGKKQNQFYAFEKKFNGGVTLAAGDFIGDGHQEIVAASGPGRTGSVRVFRKNGARVAEFLPFGRKYTDGLTITTLDLEGDGKDEIAIARSKGKPEVVIYSVSKGLFKNIKKTFLAYPSSKMPVSLTAGDLNGDGKDELITIPAQYNKAQLRVFSLQANKIKQKFSSFYVFPQNIRGAFTLAAGDINGNGKDEILVGFKSRNTEQIKIIGINRNGNLAHLNSGFYAFSKNNKNGVRISTADINADGRQEILVSEGTLTKQNVRIFDGKSLRQIKNIIPFPKSSKLIVNLSSGIF